MRRNAGSYLRSRLFRMGILATAGAGVIIGLGLVPLFILIDIWAGRIWAGAAYLGTAGLVYIFVRRFDRPSRRWNFDNVRKGLDAETRVGQVIEYAITAKDCAVAHSVSEIAKVGDIDHIVVTPRGIWVIETKYRKVPRKAFREVLSRIVSNTDAVREWAPAGTHVRGCLVLAHETENVKESYSHGHEKIAVYTADSLFTLVGELRKEARGRRLLDAQIAKDVWKLGRITE